MKKEMQPIRLTRGNLDHYRWADIFDDIKYCPIGRSKDGVNEGVIDATPIFMNSKNVFPEIRDSLYNIFPGYRHKIIPEGNLANNDRCYFYIWDVIKGKPSIDMGAGRVSRRFSGLPSDSFILAGKLNVESLQDARLTQYLKGVMNHEFAHAVLDHSSHTEEDLSSDERDLLEAADEARADIEVILRGEGESIAFSRCLETEEFQSILGGREEVLKLGIPFYFPEVMKLPRTKLLSIAKYLDNFGKNRLSKNHSVNRPNLGQNLIVSPAF